MSESNLALHKFNEVANRNHSIAETWINNIEETGSNVKKKGGSVETVRTPQNIDVVRASFEQSPHRSAVPHSKKLGLIHLFLQMLKYVIPYKCNCIIVSNIFNFFKT